MLWLIGMRTTRQGRHRWHTCLKIEAPFFTWLAFTSRVMPYKHLCCLSNASMPGIVKVCMTEKQDPESILVEANVYDTWVPEPYKLEFSKRVSKGDEIHNTLHDILVKYAAPRNLSKGFYEISIAEVSKFFDLIEEKPSRQVKKFVSSSDAYRMFRKERIRLPFTTEEIEGCRHEPITTNRIRNIMSAWRKEMYIKDINIDLNTQEFIEYLIEDFGEPVNGKEWHTIKVFGSDHEVADWDAAHVLTTSGKIKVFTITDDLPSANENTTS